MTVFCISSSGRQDFDGLLAPRKNRVRLPRIDDLLAAESRHYSLTVERLGGQSAPLSAILASLVTHRREIPLDILWKMPPPLMFLWRSWAFEFDAQMTPLPREMLTSLLSASGL